MWAVNSVNPVIPSNQWMVSVAGEVAEAEPQRGLLHKSEFDLSFRNFFSNGSSFHNLRADARANDVLELS